MNRSRHAVASKADHTHSALGDVLQGKVTSLDYEVETNPTGSQAVMIGVSCVFHKEGMCSS
jgi:hypothetical protein